MSLKINTIRIFISDLEKALEFYQKILKLNVISKDLNSGWAQIEAAPAVYLGLEVLSQNEDEFTKLVGRFTGVSFGVDDIHTSYQQLSRLGVDFLGPPQTQSWGGILAHFKDPDLNTLTLVQEK